MAKHDANLLRRFRVECLHQADKSVKKFTQKNKKVLTERITDAVNDLKVQDTKNIMHSAYKLYSAATSFGRPDISNLADLLKRMMRNPDLAASEEVLKAFEDALIEFSGFDRPQAAREKKILDSIYNVLRKHNS